MRSERESLVRRMFGEANHRNEKPTEKEKLIGRIYNSVAGLFMHRVEYDDTDKNQQRIKPLGPFPYLENDSDNSPFHSVRISAIYDGTPGLNPSYFFLIDIQEDGSSELKRLFLVTGRRLEGPLGRTIDSVGALKKYEAVIKKIVADGNKHLPTNSPS